MLGLGAVSGTAAAPLLSLAAYHQLAARAFQHGHKVLLMDGVETASGGRLEGGEGVTDDCTCHLVLQVWRSVGVPGKYKYV